MSFWSVVFSYSMQHQENISPLDCDMWQKVDFIGQLAMTNSVAGPRRSSKALPKAKLAPKKGHGLCLVVCCWSDALEISEFHYIWEVWSANSWDLPKTATPAAGVGQQQQPNSSLWQRPITHCTTNASKLEQTGLQRFTSATIFTRPLTNRLPLLQAS